jgi:hypothetical protein
MAEHRENVVTGQSERQPWQQGQADEANTAYNHLTI